MRRDYAQFRSTRQRGTVVTVRMVRHTASRSLIIECKNGIRCTSCLESPDLLKVFTLKKKGRPADVIQPRIGQDGGAMIVCANPFVRDADRIQFE